MFRMNLMRIYTKLKNQFNLKEIKSKLTKINLMLLNGKKLMTNLNLVKIKANNNLKDNKTLQYGKTLNKITKRPHKWETSYR
jgi:hypothetical protein